MWLYEKNLKIKAAYFFLNFDLSKYALHPQPGYWLPTLKPSLVRSLLIVLKQTKVYCIRV